MIEDLLAVLIEYSSCDLSHSSGLSPSIFVLPERTYMVLEKILVSGIVK